MTTRRHDEVIGADTVARATGRARKDWFGLLDAAGAEDWAHQRIAEWLVTEHDVDGWWAQSLTVGYEQARGMRLPGQRQDGTFDANVSKTVGAPAEETFAHVVDDALRTAWVPGWQVVSASAPRRARITDDDGARVVVELAAGAGKVRVAVQHGRLPDVDAVAEWKDFWRAALGRLADRATDGGA
ncbi:hypothetical protein [Georgenia satyanarayanai]|uniref:hypothetical protein n=1 Tax=Georgenia satyanarayanai TaxID=860221 RepID=UPI0012645F77|nr:hypothetical protein [Georgenia satyanarayanai]